MSRLQPVGQKRLTNICIVRLKRNGKRFEVAAYRNTVVSWRNKVEKDIDEVLQVHTIYSNVDKGILAKSEDMVEAFGTDNEDVVCIEVLNRGEFQVSEEERQMMVDTLFKDVASRVADMCVDPETRLPYPVTTIERAMRETLHFAPATNRSAKMQALQVIRQLESVDVLPIVRAKMHLRVLIPEPRAAAALEALKALGAGAGSGNERLVMGSTEVSPPAAGMSALSTTACHADPGLFRPISDLAREHGGSVQVIELKANNADEPPKLPTASAAAPSSTPGAATAASGLPTPLPLPLAPEPAPAVSPPATSSGSAQSASSMAAGGVTGAATGAGSARAGAGGASDAAARRAERMFKLNLKNADKGDPVAQLEAGKAYLDGVGVEVDMSQGRYWLEQAAQQGVNAATLRLEALAL
uniref:SBDS family rRNA metabolism protein n=1 Tax=Haptolina brevifila TaxID=156173 RepID=A0A7S2JFG7_9EUKA|mmetsp:Transcript_8153/g.16525  ORF Transcript_8153/g.16525 Transcript_8153/m.16525 type:complete len:413 (+) Transcript_8153:92-1330(+)|eukprot:CAMPEP_0174725844 /NCGR_PEP_ID=MMETSP1094-20130205/46531_1 /TAXON_ID=156173 /ORGANISM="Chrysochromulina brevifilum, Strain UTEX LB 985" /LENGTH=412 /DNA_ID=CAMNT_0015927323 /DNA_START=81 /DNA_END=1319 /DNA_ORIENTATION=+